MADDRFVDHFTPQQDTALRKLLVLIQARHPGITKTTGHNRYASKACPGFHVGDWLRARQRPIESKPAPEAPPASTGFLAALLALLRAFLRWWR